MILIKERKKGKVKERRIKSWKISLDIKSEIKIPNVSCRRGAKNRVDTVTMRRVTSPTGIIYTTARPHRRKLRQTIYKLRVTTVQPELLLIIPQRIITVPPYFTVQFILRVQRITIHLYPPVVVENILYPI